MSARRSRLTATLLAVAAGSALTACGSVRGERVMTSADGSVIEVASPSPSSLPPADVTAATPQASGPVIAVAERASIPAMLEFASTLLDGDTVTGADLFGNGPVVMTFVQPTCPISKDEAPNLADAARLNPDITYVVVHSGGSLDDYRATIAGAGLDASNIVHIDDSDQSLWHRFGVQASPSSILVDDAGLVRSSYGALGESGLDRAAVALRAGF